MRPTRASNGTRDSLVAGCPRRGESLLGVLLNPPSASTGTRSLGALRRAADVLGYKGVEVVNLFGEPTPTVVELASLAVDSDSWPAIQLGLRAQLRTAGGVLAAWGVAGASGEFKRERERRATWLVCQAARCGHDHVWTVGGEPRHPSRWHQYVADKHMRTSGGTFEERLAQVLVSTPIQCLAASVGSGVAATSP